MTEQQIFDQVLPELRGGLPRFIRWLSKSPLTNKGVRVRRFVDALINLWVTRGTELREIPGGNGQPPVPVVIIDNRIDRSASTPAVLHIHGGGYTMGRPGLQVPILKRVSADLNCLVVSVDYRLAPETQFPGSLEDNYAALAWLHQQARVLGVDPQRIAILGESAGGGHAAALAIAARDRSEFPICLQILIYPMLDDRTACNEDPDVWSGHFVWAANANQFGWRALLGCEPGADATPTGAVPARVTDLTGLPPAWIGVGELDLFHAEDVAYAKRLQEAGVPTELYTQPGAYHGFDLLAGQAPVSRAFTRSWQQALARAFAS